MSDRRSRPRLGAALTLLLCSSTVPAVFGDDAAAPRKVDFNRDIRPILSDHCYACHGPDKGRRKADLRLDTQAGLFARTDDSTIIVPGKPNESELIERIGSDDPEVHMPPPKSGKTLSNEQVTLIRRWVEEGAAWKGHWAFEKPIRHDVPSVEEPGFVKNPIDKFLLARLQQAKLTHAPEADRATLIRRLSLDLTGLPPSKEQVRAFLADTQADAYERLVDRLLDSPHYGERMAIFWLDLVRFADTIGYHSDNPMNVWPYRDYVIRSFNKNVPFDRFSVEQLAGDLIPDGSRDAKIASGYNRLLQTTEEGGAQAKEYMVKYAADRVRNASTVWLGATMGCAECHDHKFDPYTQRDFYGLAAFFADIQEAAVGRREPGMPSPTVDQDAELKQVEGAIAAAQSKLDRVTPELSAAQSAWEQDRRRGEVAWVVLNPEAVQVAGESTLKPVPGGGGVFKSVGKVAARETYTLTARTELKGITGFRIEALTDPALPQGGPGTAPDGNFLLSELRIAATADRPGAEPVTIPITSAVADFAQDGSTLAAAFDGDNRTGWGIAPATGRSHVAVLEAGSPLGSDAPTKLTFTLEFRTRSPQQNIGKLRLSATTAANPAGQWVPPYVRDTLAVDPAKRTTRQERAVAAYYRSIAPALQPLRDELALLEKRKAELLRSVPTTLIAVAGAPREIKLLPRGNWLDESGPVITPGAPQFLAAFKVDGRRPNRLDLARWVVARENPLTARVFVNRLWRAYFGLGLSKILDDLGSQGEWPTHPELLDWLAVEFMDSGWDVKHMVRLLITSGAYRQSSHPSAEQKEHDPYNRLLSHQVAFRLDAEVVRDNALAIAGLLSERVGGPSVMPYQPPGYWDQLNFPRRVYQHDHGERLYRRGMYTHWQRTFPNPSLVAFDAPSREECTAERARSDIPQQALVLLNDPTYVEAARAFAGRIVKEGGDTIRDRAVWAFETALARKPTEDELQLLADLYRRHLDQYSDDGVAARLLLGVGETARPENADLAELAAWTSVTRAILNLHETITRH